MSKKIKSLAYLASAGSGKTFALSVRYISLLFLDVEPNTILTATFTNKSALEMKHRIIDSLINLPKREDILNALSNEIGLSHKEILVKQPEVLERFLTSSNHIVTLDSFFSSILRSSSLYIGLEPDFVTKDIDLEIKEENFLEEVRENSLLQSLVKLVMDIEDNRFLKLFELMQNFYKIEPLLPKIDYKIDSLAKKEKEIDTQRELILQLVLKSKASKSAIKNFEPIEVKDFFKKSLFEKSSLSEHRFYKKYVEKNPQIDIEFGKLKEMLKEWSDIKEQVILHNLFKLFDYYKNANILTAKSLGVLSFDDLTFFTSQLLLNEKNINREFLYFKMDTHFKHILLDEFQDTSTLQFLLLKPLIDEIFSGGEEFRTFFYVGDTKQSLYRFRGGVEELFEIIANIYNIKIAQMEINYRSSKNIVEQVNIWFKSMQNYFPQKTLPNAEDGFVEVIEDENLVDEAIRKLEWFLEKGVDLSDISFLVSTNRDGVYIQDACYKKGYETRLKTSSSLKFIPKVASVVAMVEYLYSGLELDAMGVLERVGKDIKDIDTSWFNPFMQPMEVVHRVVLDFGYFEDDLNILKLLEFSSQFSDIVTFLEEFNLSSIEVASSSKKGATIMTIHSSKGLQFNYVIIVDRLKGEAPNRSALIYDYDDALYIRKLYYKMGGRENFDIYYKKLIEKEKILVKRDKMNLLYVALTRAVNGMVVIRKPKGSIFDIIGLKPLTLGTLKVSKKAEVKKDDIKKDIELRYYGVQEIANIEDIEEDINSSSIRFGIALHYTLEIISSFKIESIEQAIISTKNRYGLDLEEDDFEEIKSRITNLILNKNFQNLLLNAEISKEQSLSFNGKFKQIDLLLKYKDNFLVVDYKSSGKFKSKHISQVEYYKNAISSITKKSTKGLIIYLLKDKIDFMEV